MAAKGFIWGPSLLSQRLVQAGTVAVVSALTLYRVGPPGVQASLSKFVSLSYPVGSKFGSGTDDIYLVLFLVLLLTSLRVFVNNLVFAPLARFAGVSPKLVPKFMEQGWTTLYYSWAFLTGFTIMYIEWGFHSDAWWTSYPNNIHSFQLKSYYLIQLSFWLHMIFVTLIEPKRSDFLVMMAHHFITTGLLVFSYSCNFTRVGTALLVEQDFADVLLPVAKMFKYAKWRRTCDVVFALFAVCWIPTRHGIFFYILWSCIFDPVRLIPIQNQVWDPPKGLFFSPIAMNIAYAALIIFQGLMLFWLSHLINAVWRALTSTGNIDDDRSDDDEDTPKKKQ